MVRPAYGHPANDDFEPWSAAPVASLGGGLLLGLSLIGNLDALRRNRAHEPAWYRISSFVMRLQRRQTIISKPFVIFLVSETSRVKGKLTGENVCAARAWTAPNSARGDA